MHSIVALVGVGLMGLQSPPLDVGKADLPKVAPCAVCTANGEGHEDEKPVAGGLYLGKAYYFCCAGCLTRFTVDPASFLGKAQRAPTHGMHAADFAAATPRMDKAIATWTCPMHPEIVQDHPGSCPLCGMALEPMTISLEEGPNEELIDMSKRFWLSLALSLPLFLIEMSSMFGGMQGGWIGDHYGMRMSFWAAAVVFVLSNLLIFE